MKKVLISYATYEFNDYREKLFQNADRFGIDECIGYSPADLQKTEFYQKNKKILDQKRGAGYWLWKPYYIIEALKKLHSEDILFYCDSGVDILANLQPLFDICKRRNGLVFTQLPRYIKDWTKRDCFILMGKDTKEIQMSQLVNAGFCLFMNNKQNLDFLHKWLNYCKDERIITDLPNTCNYENYEGFVDHRHDQSILSILIASAKMEVYRDPSQYGNSRIFDFSNSNYPQLLNHQRTENNKIKSKIFINKIKVKLKLLIITNTLSKKLLSNTYKSLIIRFKTKLFSIIYSKRQDL